MLCIYCGKKVAPRRKRCPKCRKYIRNRFRGVTESELLQNIREIGMDHSCETAPEIRVPETTPPQQQPKRFQAILSSINRLARRTVSK